MVLPILFGYMCEGFNRHLPNSGSVHSYWLVMETWSIIFKWPLLSICIYNLMSIVYRPNFSSVHLNLTPHLASNFLVSKHFYWCKISLMPWPFSHFILSSSFCHGWVFYVVLQFVIQIPFSFIPPPPLSCFLVV